MVILAISDIGNLSSAFVYIKYCIPNKTNNSLMHPLSAMTPPDQLSALGELHAPYGGIEMEIASQ